MNRFIITIIAIILSSCALLAQNNRDYLVNREGEKITGTIKNLDWVINPNVIEFKVLHQDHYKAYSVKKIKAFYVQSTDRHFASHLVKLNQSSHKTEALTFDRKPKMEEVTLFLETLYDGDLFKLYKYIDSENRNHFFIKPKDKAPIELIYHKYSVIHNEATQTNTPDFSKRYIGQLNFFFRDCLTMTDKINQLGYIEDSFIEIFNDYHICKERDESSIKQNKKTPIHLSVYSGLTLSNLKFKVNSYSVHGDGLSKNPSGITIGPNIGFDLNFTIPAKYKIISFYLGSRYYSRNIDHSYQFTPLDLSTIGGTSSSRDIKLDISTKYIVVAAGLGFNFFQEKKVNPFFRIGIAANATIKNSASLYDETVQEYPELINDGMHEELTFTPEFELGANIYNFFVSVSFLYNYNGYTQNTQTSSSQTNIFMNAGYRFLLNKKSTKGE